MVNKPRILFVDDESNVLDGLRRALGSHHAARWEMTFCNSPQDALVQFKANAYDVVVSDMKMPMINGIELVLAMRKIRQNAEYIILTGEADLKIAIDAINRAEIFRFFTKPCHINFLVEGIEAACKSKARAVMSSAASLGEVALDSLAVGVLVVDAGAHVLFMNRRGREICAVGDGLMIGPDKICRTSTPPESASLHELIRLAAEKGSGGSMSVARPLLGSPLSVVVAAASGLRDAGAAAIYLRDPDDANIPSSTHLASIFGLTPAEAHIAHSLSLGLSLVEAARVSGITVGTARNYLKRVFLKTGVSRQAELVRLVLNRVSPVG